MVFPSSLLQHLINTHPSGLVLAFLDPPDGPGCQGPAFGRADCVLNKGSQSRGGEGKSVLLAKSRALVLGRVCLEIEIPLCEIEKAPSACQTVFPQVCTYLEGLPFNLSMERGWLILIFTKALYHWLCKFPCFTHATGFFIHSTYWSL